MIRCSKCHQWKKGIEFTKRPKRPKGHRSHCKKCRAETERKESRDLRLRFMILNRDNFTCQYCGRTPQDGAKLEIDHIIPHSKGGLDNEDNLITACKKCNLGKSDILL